MRLSAIDRRILNTIQENIPFSARPFEALAEKAGIGEAYLLKKLTELKKKGLIKDYAARINHKKLGYKSTLVGLKAPADMLERIAKEIIIYPEVTHCFQRKGEYNLWVVFIYKNRRLESILRKIAKSVVRRDILNLKTVRKFKLKTRLEV